MHPWCASNRNEAIAIKKKSPARRKPRERGSNQSYISSAVRTPAREVPQPYLEAGSHPQGARGRCVLDVHQRCAPRMRSRRTRRTRFRNPLKAGSHAQGVGRRRVLEYSSLPTRSVLCDEPRRTQRVRFRSILTAGRRCGRRASHASWPYPPSCRRRAWSSRNRSGRPGSCQRRTGP